MKTIGTYLAAGLAALSTWGSALASPGGGGSAIDPAVEEALRGAPPSAQITVLVRLRGQEDLGRFGGLPRHRRVSGVVGALRARAEADQAGIRGHLLQERALGRVSRVEPLWVVNGLSVTGSPDAIRALAARDDVAGITPDEIPLVPTAAPVEPNVEAVRAPELWGLGFLGQGAVVAILDSGVDVTHPDLASRYRGGPNGWFDPYGQHATPYDRTGHGTWTAGVVLGGDSGGASIGVAPGATFVAARVWNDAGSATATAVHRAFQWILDPDGNAGTSDAPDVVNGSWAYGSPGCNPEFQPDLRALRAAGIVPVFAAGNYGPGSQTSVSPANYPEALSVGAVDAGGAIAYDSSRGPSACGGATYPTVVAPGVDVVTSDLFALYASVSGTSIAAPHVSGVLALLLGAAPGATGEQAESALVGSARDLGVTGPDDDFGHGLVDAAAAWQVLQGMPAPAPTANGDAYALAENTTLSVAAPGVLANDDDPAGMALTASLVAAPVNGTVTLQPSGAFTYLPRANFHGTDSFTYRASNGTTASDVATVSLTVTFVNQAPVAKDDAASTSKGKGVTVKVVANDTDVDGTVVASSVTIGTSPRNGTASSKGDGTVVYTPRKGFTGADSFTYTVKDDAGARSNVATVAVQVK